MAAKRAQDQIVTTAAEPDGDEPDRQRRVARRRQPTRWVPPAGGASIQSLSAQFAFMFAGVERLGEQSPAALLVCDPFLVRNVLTQFTGSPCAARMKVFGWGPDDIRPDGLAGPVIAPIPLDVPAGRSVRLAAAGSRHMVAVLDGNEVATWGDGMHGQRGLVRWSGSRMSILRFPGGGALPKVQALACGAFHTLVLLETGAVLGWGQNAYGQLGIDPRIHEHVRVPVCVFDPETLHMRARCIACAPMASCVAADGGAIFTWGMWRVDCKHRVFNRKTTTIPDAAIASVAIGDGVMAAVTDAGVLYTTPMRDAGVCDIDGAMTAVRMPRDRTVSAVACGDLHVLALLDNGEVYAWGSNAVGQLGVGHAVVLGITLPNIISVYAGEPKQVPFPGQTQIVSVRCMHNTSFAVARDGRVFAWGDNEYGRLAIGSTRDIVVAPTQIGALAADCVLDVQAGPRYTIVLIAGDDKAPSVL